MLCVELEVLCVTLLMMCMTFALHCLFSFRLFQKKITLCKAKSELRNNDF